MASYNTDSCVAWIVNEVPVASVNQVSEIINNWNDLLNQLGLARDDQLPAHPVDLMMQRYPEQDESIMRRIFRAEAGYRRSLGEEFNYNSLRSEGDEEDYSYDYEEEENFSDNDDNLSGSE